MIFVALEYRPFGAAAQKLDQHRVLRLPHVLRRSLFDNFSLIQHCHTRRDMERAVHQMRDDDRSCLCSFSEIND